MLRFALRLEPVSWQTSHTVPKPHLVSRAKSHHALLLHNTHRLWNDCHENGCHETMHLKTTAPPSLCSSGWHAQYNKLSHSPETWQSDNEARPSCMSASSCLSSERLRNHTIMCGSRRCIAHATCLYPQSHATWTGRVWVCNNLSNPRTAKPLANYSGVYNTMWSGMTRHTRGCSSNTPT